MPTFQDFPLGRQVPPDDMHIQLFGLRAVLPAAAPAKVEKVFRLPTWHWSHDQGAEGSCVGHATAMERAITNSAQNRAARAVGIKQRRYDPIAIWNEAKVVDGDSSTNPGDDNGTYVRAAYDIMRDHGPRRVRNMVLNGSVPVPIGAQPPVLRDGADVNRWARTVDEMRAAIASGTPSVIGVNWYSAFDVPKPDLRVEGDHWLAPDGRLGSVRGGHSVCIYGASDRRQAFRVKNSWGGAFPLVWLPYKVMERLLREDGEAAVVTDR
ncbi:MAG: hypothetical protein ABW167_20575 [Baekduia sp.]